MPVFPAMMKRHDDSMMGHPGTVLIVGLEYYCNGSAVRLSDVDLGVSRLKAAAKDEPLKASLL